MKLYFRKSTLLFGVILITLLMLSTATAVQIKGTKSNGDQEKNNDIYLGDIYISKKNLPIFEKAVYQIKDETNRNIVLKTIEKLKTQGEVDTEGMSEILDELKVNDRSIYSGFIHAKGGSPNCWAFPFYWAGVVMSWSYSDHPSNDPVCKINGRTVKSGPNSGIGIGGIGGWMNGYWNGQVDGSCSGLFALIIVE